MRAAFIKLKPLGARGEYEIELQLSGDGKPTRVRSIGGCKFATEAKEAARIAAAALLLAGYAVTGA